jgi:hypothetical protein
MLRSDYEILNDSLNGSLEMNPRRPLEDVQTSIQSIQSFKEPAKHYKISPALKERHISHISQYEDLIASSKMFGKENAYDFSKKTNSLPQVDDDNNFSRYFD